MIEDVALAALATLIAWIVLGGLWLLWPDLRDVIRERRQR